MSSIELRDFEKQLDMLSFAERLAVVDYLIKSMQTIVQNQSVVADSKKDWVDDLFVMMDANPILSGEKWTREELYER
ncbi:MAG: hypothetical protein J5631_10565 [Spirochaetaceae bacterium]|nr:hypothetical protein [Spirochaetaceae bacterium]